MRHSPHSILKPCASAVCLALLLVGCSNDYTVQLASAGEQLPRLSFVVEDKHPSEGEGLSYRSIEVEDLDAAVTVWKTSRFGDLPTAPRRITYGEEPKAFQPKTSMAPLKPNTKYAIVVAGPGEMIGRLQFRIDAAGKAVVD